jgi:hypothetical protein
MQPSHFSETYLNHVSIANPKWRFIRSLTLLPTLHRDCIIPLLRATDVDHLSYVNLGHELPLRDVVPLNRHTHIVVGALRKMGFAPLVNLALRLSYATWLCTWVYVGAVVAHQLGIVAAVPTPAQIVASGGAAAAQLLSSLTHPL